MELFAVALALEHSIHMETFAVALAVVPNYLFSPQKPSSGHGTCERIHF